MLAGRFGSRACFDRPDDLLDLSLRDHSGPENSWDIGDEREHRTFDTDGAGASVENHVDARAEAFAHVFRSGGGEFGEAIGAGRRDGDLGGFEQRLRERMCGYAQTYTREAGGYKIRDVRALREDQRQRPGPESTRQEFGGARPVEGELLRHRDARDVNDQRAGMRPAFGFEDAADWSSSSALAPRP
jgi:hypothetical protein